MKTILVTGGAGYIGSHTLIELIAHNFNVVVIDNLVNANVESLRRVEKITNTTIHLFKQTFAIRQCLIMFLQHILLTL